jgi:hypothetical protein
MLVARDEVRIGHLEVSDHARLGGVQAAIIGPRGHGLPDQRFQPCPDPLENGQVQPGPQDQVALIQKEPALPVPVANRHRSDWGDPEPWGLLAPDWRGVANPGVLDLLKSMIPPRTGPGVAG